MLASTETSLGQSPIMMCASGWWIDAELAPRQLEPDVVGDPRSFSALLLSASASK